MPKKTCSPVENITLEAATIGMDDATIRYRNPLGRYASFLRFPLASAWPSRLAAAGFYFTGSDDRVVCFSCGQSYAHWRPEDNPVEIHRQISPSCKFVLEQEESEPITTYRNPCKSSSQLSLSNLPNLHLSGFLSGSSSTSAPTLHAPRHRDYVDVQTRISSFQYRSPCHHYQSPRELAEAGFFFSGNSHDSTICFYCGGGLRNWKQGDNPYVKHARRFPQCDFIRSFDLSNYDTEIDIHGERN